MRESLAGRRSSRASNGQRVYQVLAPVVALVILAACSVSNQLDTSQGESEIKTFLEDKLGIQAAVSCPDRELKQGDVFECTAELGDGQSLRMQLTQDDDEGNVSLKQAQAIIDVEQAVALIEQEVQSSANVTVTADCGTTKFLIKDPGTTFDCQVIPTAGGPGGRAVVTVNDVDGAVDVVVE